VLLRACRPGFQRKPELPIPQQAKDVVKLAKSYLPEENPPTSRLAPNDCSSFVQSVYRANGIKLPRTAARMAEQGTGVAADGLRMGDLVFFSGARGGRKVGHVGIFVHNGIFIHVPEGKVGAQLESLHIDYYRQRFLCARRVID
jgi:hypothetical protein